MVKERTDPRTLPGVEAMMPGSALTRLLNATPELVTTADLSVIAGDIEAGDGLWNTLKVLATDWFYKNEHDLVVDTRLPCSAACRASAVRRAIARTRGLKVNHFRYFTNDQSVRWLSAGLSRADGDNAGFQSLAPKPAAAPRCAAAIARSRGGNKPRPIAVVLPGTMGSELVAGDDPVWLNYWALLKGGLKKIAMGREGIAPVGLVDQFYGPLVEFLARSHQVEIFPYDWRFSVRKAAARLVGTLEPLVAQAERSGQPLRLVAHSMGGLVVRSMIADGGAGTALWKRITQLPGARFLMLGTPNLGSYEAVRWLTGFNPTQAKLSLLDITQSTDQIINLVARYPGLLELLPFAPDDPDFTDTARWQDPAQGARRPLGHRPGRRFAGSRRHLEIPQGRRARPALHGLRGGLPAGHRHRLPADAGPGACSAPTSSASNSSPPARATAPWPGPPAACPACRCGTSTTPPTTALCAQPKAFPAYLDILVNGQTTLLSSSPPARARAAAGEARFVLPAAPPADGMPSAEDIAGFGFSGQLPEAGGRRTHHAAHHRQHPPRQPDLRPPSGARRPLPGRHGGQRRGCARPPAQRPPDPPPRSRHLPRPARQPQRFPQRLAGRQADGRHRRRPRRDRRAQPGATRSGGARCAARLCAEGRLLAGCPLRRIWPAALGGRHLPARRHWWRRAAGR